VFPNRCLADFSAVCDPEGPDDSFQAVPTGVVKGPHGDLFMSELTGFPFPVGAANVYRVDRRTGEAEVFASGFTNIMDLAFDDNGTLWVLEIDHDGLASEDPPGSTDGAIYAVNQNGEKEQLELDPGTLTHPGGITVAEDGALYVTNNADMADEGEVLRIEIDENDKEDGGENCGPHS
jgi:glucose/arabinose dehydrogenase